MNTALRDSLSKWCVNLDARVPGAATWLLPGFVVFASLLLWAGYEAGSRINGDGSREVALAELTQKLAAEREHIDQLRVEQRAHLDALALRIGQMQARLMRLDALGERLVGVGKLDASEFDFAADPPQGGIETAATSQDIGDIDSDMQRLNAMLNDREDKLDMLEQQLLNRDLRAQVMPSGRPVKKGWISSRYGRRTDPFTGKKTLHRGMDFAGRKGSQVHAVAAGVVKRSSKVAGYGNLVEIRHPDGYSTLYGHNNKNLVKVGQMVTKGQVIALLGSSGRSSGPHVHFEVHKNGRTVDPKRYIRAP